MEGSKPTFSVTVQEISTKTISITADDWHEALMRAIKLHDYGAISASDTTSSKTEVNISVEGYPYEIHDTWNIEDVENHIENHGYTFTPELTEGEKRQILARNDALQASADTHGLGVAVPVFGGGCDRCPLIHRIGGGDMQVKFCYKCGRKFKEGEGHHLLYNERIDKMVPVCREDAYCEWQRPGRAAKAVVKYCSQ